MNTLIVHTQDDNQLNATEAFLNALKIPFEKVKEDEPPYDPEFVAKIEKSMEEAKDGKLVKIALNDIWK